MRLRSVQKQTACTMDASHLNKQQSDAYRDGDNNFLSILRMIATALLLRMMDIPLWRQPAPKCKDG